MHKNVLKTRHEIKIFYLKKYLSILFSLSLTRTLNTNQLTPFFFPSCIHNTQYFSLNSYSPLSTIHYVLYLGNTDENQKSRTSVHLLYHVDLKRSLEYYYYVHIMQSSLCKSISSPPHHHPLQFMSTIFLLVLPLL